MMARLSPDILIIGAMFIASLGALAAALIAQYEFDLYPCELCLFQRLPYIGVLALSLLSLMPAVDVSSRRLAIQVGAMLFATTAAIAAFHAGVEQGWWKTFCAPTGPQTFSVGDIQSALQRTGTPACDEIPFTLLGLSLAGLNMVAGLVLAGLALWASRSLSFWKSE